MSVSIDRRNLLIFFHVDVLEKPFLLQAFHGYICLYVFHFHRQMHTETEQRRENLDVGNLWDSFFSMDQLFLGQ